MELPPFELLLKQIKLNLKYAGIPFNETPNKPVLAFGMFIIFGMCLNEIAYFSSRIAPENLVELAQLTPCLVVGAMSLVKILTVLLNRNKIFRLTILLGELYEQILADKDKLACVRKEVVGIKTITKYYFIMNFLLTFLFDISVLVVMIHVYVSQGIVTFIIPYSMGYPVLNSWFRWASVYGVSVIGGFICVLYFTTSDMLYCNLTCQVCINFSVLSNEIQNLTEFDGLKLREIVEKHQYLLQLSHDLEDICTSFNFYNVLGQSLIICALLFNLTAGELANMPSSVVFVISAVLQILVMSFFGENLKNESTKIGDAAYLCDWYKMNQKNKKMIVIITQRALKPQVLTAYKFTTIDYACFSKIMRTSWSFFTLLSTVYDSA